MFLQIKSSRFSFHHFSPAVLWSQLPYAEQIELKKEQKDYGTSVRISYSASNINDKNN